MQEHFGLSMRQKVQGELICTIDQSWSIGELRHALGQHCLHSAETPRWLQVPIRTVQLAEQAELVSSGQPL